MCSDGLRLLVDPGVLIVENIEIAGYGLTFESTVAPLLVPVTIIAEDFLIRLFLIMLKT